MCRCFLVVDKVFCMFSERLFSKKCYVCAIYFCLYVRAKLVSLRQNRGLGRLLVKRGGFMGRFLKSKCFLRKL